MIYAFFESALLTIFWLALYAAGWIVVMLIIGYTFKVIMHIISTIKGWLK